MQVTVALTEQDNQLVQGKWELNGEIVLCGVLEITVFWNYLKVVSKVLQGKGVMENNREVRRLHAVCSSFLSIEEHNVGKCPRNRASI